MRLASAVETMSSHPIAAAFVEFAQSLEVEQPECAAFELLEGEGVQGTVDGVQVHVGSERLARRVLEEREQKRAAMPSRMRRALEKKEAAARAERIKAEQAAKAGGEQRKAEPPAVP